MESKIRPRLSTVAQNVGLGHETETISYGASTPCTVHEPLPSMGSVEVMMPPAWSAATQNAVVGHDTASTTTPGLTLTFDHASTPPVGLVETTTLPSPSPATQSDVAGHQTAANQVPGSTSDRFQVAAPPVGFVDVSTLPPASTATHRLASGHDTHCMWVSGPRGGVLSIGPVLDQFNDGVVAATAAVGTASSPSESAITANERHSTSAHLSPIRTVPCAAPLAVQPITAWRMRQGDSHTRSEGADRAEATLENPVRPVGWRWRHGPRANLRGWIWPSS